MHGSVFIDLSIPLSLSLSLSLSARSLWSWHWHISDIFLYCRSLCSRSRVAHTYNSACIFRYSDDRPVLDRCTVRLRSRASDRECRPTMRVDGGVSVIEEMTMARRGHRYYYQWLEHGARNMRCRGRSSRLSRYIYVFDIDRSIVPWIAIVIALIIVG